MANIKSNKKRTKTNEKSRQRNVAYRSMIKTAIKKVLASLETETITAPQELLRETESLIARACSKGILKKNTAARKISSLARTVAQATKLPAAV